MQVKFFTSLLLLLVSTNCSFAQGFPRPSFPDVFQTEIEGTFVQENAVVEIDASMFYDRTNNRAALFVTKEGDLTKLIYNFDSDEGISIGGNDCEVEVIEDVRIFPFTTVDGKKRMASPDEVLFFSKSKLDKESSSKSRIPELVYTAMLDIPRHEQKNCNITHIFSKPDLELPTCREGLYCNSTLMSISVICKNENGGITADHFYRFSRFKSEIVDESVFLPPVGIHCDMKSTEIFPKIPSYFSFTFDIVDKPEESADGTAVFNTHKQVWYDAEYKIIRIDEFGFNEVQYSTRIFDLKGETAFTIIASVPSCEIGPVSGNITLEQVTRLPKAFFSQSDSDTKSAVYVGKRKVHGLDYKVWSLSWPDRESEARVVEEVYFLQVSSNEAQKAEMHLQMSHVDMYVYESTNDDSSIYELDFLKHFSINDFQSTPKEWVAFDIATCVRNTEKIEFIMKVEGPKLIKESESYREVLQLFYSKILTITDVSIVRISELTGIFDGANIIGIRGLILNNSESSGFTTMSQEPTMEEVFEMIEQEVSEKKFSITFKGENDITRTINVISVKAVQVTSGEFPRPSFPDVFETEIEGIFVDADSVETIHASIFYDRGNNRAALFMTKDGELTKSIYNFESDEMLSITGNECGVEDIEEQIFLPFVTVNGKKILLGGDQAFSFSNSKLDRQIFPDNNIPTLVYKANIDLPQFGNINCEVTHIFSKPDLWLPDCGEGVFCNSTLMSMVVKCKDENSQIAVNNSYRFSRFKPGIEDETVFLTPAGVYCKMKNTKTLPSFPSYFSFTFDIIENLEETGSDTTFFTTHKEVWYDADYRIIRIDEFDNNGLLFTSRIFDFKAEAAFTIIASIPTCDIVPFTGDIDLDATTSLPKAFFSQNDTAVKDAVYIGKRKVHGLDYQVWSLSWSVEETRERIVEEIYFLEVISNTEPSLNETERETYLQISHVDMYTYEESTESDEYELALLKHFSINNYRSKPKEWAAFDVDTCFKNKQKKEFVMKVEGPELVKGSLSYGEVLEQLYNKIIDYTGVSIVRISELTGVFDGVKLVEIRGSILDNPESSGWPKDSKEPGMEEAFNLMKKAASKNQLSITFTGENNIEYKLNVTSVEAVEPHGPKGGCYTGASMAAASLVMLLIGMTFGVIGYYVFLKKRRSPNVFVRMSEIKPDEHD